MSEIFHIPVKYASSFESESSYKPEVQPEATESAELAVVEQPSVAEVPSVSEVESVDQASQQIVALKAAEVGVHEALETKSVGETIDGLDFSEKNYFFVAGNSYHAPAETGTVSTRTEGLGLHGYGGHITHPHYLNDESKSDNAWGNPSHEAHYGRQPVEKVGIRQNPTWDREPVEKTVPAPGWKGKLGFKRTLVATEYVKRPEPVYTFDYEFAAPSHSDDASATEAGNNTAQHIRLNLNLSKEQAVQLSKAIEADSTVARSVVDAFVSKTGDIGKWNAEIFDEKGNFYDPGANYGNDLLARDVRPRYDAVPDLKPQVIGLLLEASPVVEAATDELEKVS